VILFRVKRTIILCELAQFFFFKNKLILNFMVFVATKKEAQPIFPPPLFLPLLDPVSGMDKNQVPG
jgi:hypothetical protein